MAALVVQSRFAGLMIEDDDHPTNSDEQKHKKAKTNSAKKSELLKKPKNNNNNNNNCKTQVKTCTDSRKYIICRKLLFLFCLFQTTEKDSVFST